MNQKSELQVLTISLKRLIVSDQHAFRNSQSAGVLANQITRLANPEEADLLIEICNVFFAIITLVSSANIAGLCWKLCEMFISEKILIFVSFSPDDRCTDLGRFTQS